MTTINHWGIWVDSETPITGVHSIHDIMWEFIDDEICLDCQSAYAQVDSETGEGEDPNYDYIECDSSHDKLIGDWIEYTGPDIKKHKEECFFVLQGYGLNIGYAPNKKTGDFAAIERETTIQVVWSKYIERHGLCSPCYPGQADMDSKGDFLCYVLPPELRYQP